MPELDIVPIDQLNGQLLTLARERVESWRDVLEAEAPSLKDSYLRISYEILLSRAKVYPEGQLVLRWNSRPIGAIHALLVERNGCDESFSSPIFDSAYVLTACGYFTTHDPAGRVIVCPESYANSRQLKAIGRKKVGSLLPLYVRDNIAIPLKNQGKLDRMAVYTRPFISKFVQAGYGYGIDDYLAAVKDFENNKDKLRGDPLGLHLYLGAKFVRLVENARIDPKTWNYCAIAEYPL